MRCIQVVKAARWLSHLLYVHENKLIFTDSRVNLMSFEKLRGSILEKEETIYPLSASYDVDSCVLVLATRKDIRVYSAITGRLCDVYQVVG